MLARRGWRDSPAADAPRSPLLLLETWQQSLGCLRLRTRRLQTWEALGWGDSEHAQSWQSRADLLCTPSGLEVPPLRLGRLRSPLPLAGARGTSWGG